MNFCDGRGYLVGGNKALPDDASEYQTELGYPVVGCNKLACNRCGAAVRSHPGLYPLSGDTALDCVAVYTTSDWSTVPGMKADPEYRLYVCRCSHYEADSERPLLRDDSDPSPWHCSGHPAADFPVWVNGVEITRSSDIERVVRENFEGDNILLALHERLSGTPLEASIAAVASRLLSDPDPRIQALAFGMYYLHPDAQGARRILELAGGERTGFVGVPDPNPISGLDLEGRLLTTLAKLWTSRIVSDQEVLALLRRDALRRSTCRAVLPSLLQRDSQWVHDHAAEIVASAPNAIGALVVGLSVWVGGSMDFLALARQATGLSPEEKARVRKELKSYATSSWAAGLMDLFSE